VSPALSGLRAWLLQRVTAVYLAAFTLYLCLHLVIAPPADLADWGRWVLSPPMAVATALFFVALLAHAWVGVRDIVLDYVRSAGLRLAVLSTGALGLVAEGLWVLRVLLGGRA
jgi:succinate dehydrogenase / fumarate reductase, membrane anchor subunit